MPNEEHPEVQAAKIQARATRQAARLAALIALLLACTGWACAVTNTVVSAVTEQYSAVPARPSTYV